MLRILLAHPDQKLSSLYCQHMQDHFQVDSAHDGLTALRRIKLHKPALIVSEYHLPILSGAALLRFVRSDEKFMGTPFIFLSDYNYHAEALSGGANDWLELKSSHPATLLERIYHHLRLNKHALQIN